jgi:hypothetical protein
LVCGVNVGSWQRVTVAHGRRVICGEGGGTVQAHNITRQGNGSPRTNGFVFMNKSPQLGLIGGQGGADCTTRAIELGVLGLALASAGEKLADDRVARAKVLPYNPRRFLGCAET